MINIKVLLVAVLASFIAKIIGPQKDFKLHAGVTNYLIINNNANIILFLESNDTMHNIQLAYQPFLMPMSHILQIIPRQHSTTYDCLVFSWCLVLYVC